MGWYRGFNVNTKFKSNFDFFKKSFSEQYDYSDTFYIMEVKQTTFHNKYDNILIIIYQMLN